MNIFIKTIRSTPILIGLALLFLFFAFHAPYFYSLLTGHPFLPTQYSALFFVICYTSVFFFIVPVIVSKWLFRFKLADLGLKLPRGNLRTVVLMCASLFLLLPCMYFFSKMSLFKAYYAFNESTSFEFILIQMTILPFYYFAEEFFFRGYLFLGLWHKVRWQSFWISDLIFFIAHIGKPWPELIYSLPAGIIFCGLTLMTRSIIPAAIVHCALGIFLNVMVNYA